MHRDREGLPGVIVLWGEGGSNRKTVQGGRRNRGDWRSGNPRSRALRSSVWSSISALEESRSLGSEGEPCCVGLRHEHK